jgi:CDP-paratose 2-epimerase
MNVISVDNRMRAYYFGPDASTNWSGGQLEKEIRSYHHGHIDIRDFDRLKRIFSVMDSL